MSYSEMLESEFRTLALNLPASQKEKLDSYCCELEHWNRKINLTSLAGVELVRRLVAEPSWIGERLGISGTVTDIGSGNGSPALPLCITRPVAKVHLVESRLKRVVFLRHLKARLMLSDVYIHHDRFEAVAPGLGDMEWITLQAVALSDSLLQSLRLVCSATTKVVWITAQRGAPTSAATRIRVPDRATEAWVFTMNPRLG